MPKAAAPPARLPWEDRWTQPALEQLFEPFKDDRQKHLNMLLEGFNKFDGIEQKLVWHGEAWRWTLEFNLTTEDGRDMGSVAYLVPNPEGLIVCIPMLAEQIDALPFKRLNKFIREGIRSAKVAVEQHWCKWMPSAMSECDHLIDLFKRKHKMLAATA